MSYKVINEFIDLSHKNTHYKVGDTYPKEGFEASKDRVTFLMKRHEKYKVAFLEEVKVEQQEKTKKKSKKSSSKD